MRTSAAGILKSVLWPAGPVAVLAALISLSGCDSGGDGPTGPCALEVELSRTAVQVTRTVTATATAAGRRGRFEVIWLVDGVPGGGDSTGVITQGNPATYTAPHRVPSDGRVVIGARLQSDVSVSASDTLAVLFTVLHVDAEGGDDGAGTGTWATPFKTITTALTVVDEGDTVLVRPGAYGPALGESPPYVIPEGVTLRGTHRDSCTLFGHGGGGAVVDLGDGAGVDNLTVRNADLDAIGINTTESGRIRRILAIEPFSYAVVRSSNGSEVVIEDCLFENTQRPLSGRGMELISGCHATVRRCTLRRWNQGAFVNTTSDPLIEDSVFEGNVFGIDTSETSEEHTEPDLGGGLRGSLGGNVIRGNATCGLASRTPGTVFAINNTWNVPPAEPPVYCQAEADSCDICVTNGGTVYWCECARE